MDLAALRRKYRAVAPGLNERSRRLWAAAEAAELGHGAIAVLVRATGLSRSTITRGLREIEGGAQSDLPPERVRRAGGGPQTRHGARSRRRRGVGRVGGGNGRRRAQLAVAVDREESARVGDRTDGARSSRESSHGPSTAAADGLSSASQSEDP